MTGSLINVLTRNPRIAAAFSGVAALVFGVLSVRCVLDARRFAGGPVSMTLAEAVAASADREVYARLDEARFDCRTTARDVTHGNQTFFLIIDPFARPLAVASFDQRLECGDIQARPLVAVFSNLNPRLRERLVGTGMRIGPATVREACVWCGPANARTGIIVCSVLTLTSLAIYPLVLLLRRRQRLASS